MNKIDFSLDPERDFSDHIKQLDDLIFQLQSNLPTIEADQKQDNIKRWKARLNDPTLKGISGWLRQKAEPVVSAAVSFQDKVSTHPQEIASYIHQYWSDLWQSNALDPTCCADQLARDFGPATQWVWRPISLSELTQAARAAKGAAGPDNWAGVEVAVLPEQALKVWHRCSLRWYSTGKVPQQLRESKQVNLLKPQKVFGNQNFGSFLFLAGV